MITHVGVKDSTHTMDDNAQLRLLKSLRLLKLRLLKTSAPIAEVDQVKYLGRVFRKDASLESEISNRIRAAWASFHNIAGFIKHATRTNKLLTLNSHVLPAATYASETWNAKSSDYARMQRTINSIWEAADANPAPQIRRLIIGKKLLWAGHVARQPASRWSHIVTMWDPRGHSRKRGRPAMRWSDEVSSALVQYRESLAQQGHLTNARRRIGTIEKRISWSTVGRNRESWNVLIHCFMKADNGSPK